MPHTMALSALLCLALAGSAVADDRSSSASQTASSLRRRLLQASNTEMNLGDQSQRAVTYEQIPEPAFAGTNSSSLRFTTVTNSSFIAGYNLSSVQYDPNVHFAPPFQQQLTNGLIQSSSNGKGGVLQGGPYDASVINANPDSANPPSTDVGSLPQLTFSFGLAHVREQPGGWTNQVTQRELPVSTAMAGVQMSLSPGGIRELHWHLAAEWSIVLSGSCRITAVDQNGQNFVHDLTPGQLWYFPEGVPHSIQGLENGVEFLLVFDDGSFSEENTFLISDWIAQIPKEVLAKNFGVNESAFANIPSKELYIFQGTVPGPIESDTVADPYGQVPQVENYFHDLIGQAPVLTNYGSVRVVDSTNFPAAQKIAAALVEVVPGGMRELHWHPFADEWQYYISGLGRMTVFAAGQNSRTFDVSAGTVGYISSPQGHYIENTGNTTLRFLELYATNLFNSVSLRQWLALTPPELVQEHLHLTDAGLRAVMNGKVANPVVGMYS